MQYYKKLKYDIGICVIMRMGEIVDKPGYVLVATRYDGSRIVLKHQRAINAQDYAPGSNGNGVKPSDLARALESGLEINLAAVPGRTNVHWDYTSRKFFELKSEESDIALNDAVIEISPPLTGLKRMLWDFKVLRYRLGSQHLYNSSTN